MVQLRVIKSNCTFAAELGFVGLKLGAFEVVEVPILGVIGAAGEIVGADLEGVRESRV